MSAVLKTDQLGTIFDHDVTDDELSVLFFGYPETKADYLEGLSADSLLVDLVRLYRLRGDTEVANRFIYQISDPDIRLEFSTRPCCVAHS